MRGRVWMAWLGALLVVLLVVLAAACSAKEEASPGGEGAPEGLDGQALVEERCSVCHDLKQVEQAKKTPEEWKANVERMVDKGAKLDDAEQQLAIDHLAETYPK